MAGGDPTSVRVFGGGDGLRNHLFRLVDGPLDPGLNDRLASEALPALDTNVGGENNGVGSLDVGGAEGLGGGGSLGFDLDVNTHLLSRSRQIVGCHVGVGDAGGTGRDSDDAGRLGGGAGRRGVRKSRCRCGWRGSLLRFDDSTDEVDDGLRVGCLPQLFDELRLDEGTSQLGKELHMLRAAVFGRRDHKDEVGWTVRSIEVDGGGQPGEPQGGLRHCG